MNKEKVMNYLSKIKQIVLFILLAIWFLIPMFKEILKTEYFIINNEYAFMEIVGMIGIYMLLFYLYKKYQKYEDKKEYVKDMMPIFLFIGYMAWTLISSIFAQDTNNAFYGTSSRKDGYITYLIYAGFFACAFFIKSDNQKKILMNLFIISSILTIVFINLSHTYLFFRFFEKNTLSKAVFHNSNHYGYYLLLVTIISALLFITEKKIILKIIYLLQYSFLLYYLIANDTFGCYLSLFMTLIIILIYCIYKKKKIYLPIIPIAIFIIMSCVVQVDGKNIALRNIKSFTYDIVKIIFSLEDREDEEKQKELEKTGSSRMILWINGIKFFVQNPILGYGPENIIHKYKEIGIDEGAPHNLIIQLATTSGIPGLLLYMGAVGLILIRSYKNMKEKESNYLEEIVFFTTISYLISAMFGVSKYYTSPYFFIVLGFLMYEITRKTDEENIKIKESLKER